MGKHDKCILKKCGNKRSVPATLIVKSHVKDLSWHLFPQKQEIKEQWIETVRQANEDSSYVHKEHHRICSNHFMDGSPSTLHPNPTIFLDAYDLRSGKRQRTTKMPAPAAAAGTSTAEEETSEQPETQPDVPDPSDRPAMIFAQLTRDVDVKIHTGLPNSATFTTLFEYLSPKAARMTHWRGPASTAKRSATAPEKKRSRDAMKLTLEQAFLMVLMRLRLGTITARLAFIFKVSESTISQEFFTWIRLLRNQLSILIYWPSRAAVRRTLPPCFKRWYPKTIGIIDCTEFFTETPSALDVQAVLYSNYKHHTTAKSLICITPTGSISYVSKCFAGRASDKQVVSQSGFYQMLRPGDELLADRGFKIQDDLMAFSAKVSIPPSCRKDLQMTTADVTKTSRLANCRIYVEQAIRRIKIFRLLKYEVPVSLLPIVDDIVQVCCALCNLLPPLPSHLSA